MNTVTSNGCSRYYEDVGEGVPILLIHPSGATASTWGSAIDELARVGRVITLATIKVPVVCSYGARSSKRMIVFTQSLASAIPTARAQQIKGSGHAVAFDATADFVRLIADTITRV